MDKIFCMYAADARIITELAKKPQNPWNKLFERIKETAEHGGSYLHFDEEKEQVQFKEPRQEVKQKLEDLGYEVSYSRVRNQDIYYGDFHNSYSISW